MSDHPYRSYMICTTPRSGSTLLCRMLASTGHAGLPDSHFHAPSLERWLQVYGLDGTDFASRTVALAAVFEAAQVRGRGGTGMFGLRMQRGSLGYFLEQLAILRPGQMCDTERIGATFGRTFFIHLTRSDRLGQAISRLRAQQTGLWHRRPDGTELERLAPPRNARYDAAEIARHMRDLTDLDLGWLRWFDRQGIDPYRIDYASLSADPRKTLAALLSALGLDHAPARAVVIPTAKLAGAESRAWRIRFEAEQRG